MATISKQHKEQERKLYERFIESQQEEHSAFIDTLLHNARKETLRKITK